MLDLKYKTLERVQYIFIKFQDYLSFFLSQPPSLSLSLSLSLVSFCL